MNPKLWLRKLLSLRMSVELVIATDRGVPWPYQHSISIKKILHPPMILFGYSMLVTEYWISSLKPSYFLLIIVKKVYRLLEIQMGLRFILNCTTANSTIKYLWGQKIDVSSLFSLQMVERKLLKYSRLNLKTHQYFTPLWLGL